MSTIRDELRQCIYGVTDRIKQIENPALRYAAIRGVLATLRDLFKEFRTDIKTTKQGK